MENINNLNRENGQKLWAADWNKLVSTINLIINVVNNQSNLPKITKLSQLINDSGFITQEDAEGITGPTATINKVGKVATITITDKNGTTTAEIKDGEGSGDMLKGTYDANNNGVVDNAEKVNNHTVESDVPTNAKFTDTQADWNENDSSSDAFINNKPVIPQLPDPYNGHEYVDLGLPSGTLWATMNVGASSETDYGNYYMYGMGSKTYNSADTTYAGTEDPLDLSKDTARVVWGGEWHMPTRAQMQELTANTTYQWVTNYKGSGINGGTFTATNGAVLFIPAAGYWYDGSQYGVGDFGDYWGSSPSGSDYAYVLYFFDGNKNVDFDDRKYGYSVRPVITPSNTLHKVSVTGDYNDLSNKPDLSGMIETTYSNLVSLRNNSQLIPGKWYRITDYQCTTTQANTQSANHPFDIIVRADSVNMLNENAYAAKHAGDTYFANSKLEAWELKYCLDNINWSLIPHEEKITLNDPGGQLVSAEYNGTVTSGSTTYYKWELSSSIYNFHYVYSTSKSSNSILYFEMYGNYSDSGLKIYEYVPASTSEGYGTIIWMKDEYNNECSYDFKNILFKIGEKPISGTITDVFYYTFSIATGTGDSTVKDFSVEGTNCFGNKIQRKNKELPVIVFRNVSAGNSCHSNTFGYKCHSNTFGANCYDNKFGNDCYDNTFGTGCNSNTFGTVCINNTFGTGCNSNTFGASCSYNTFGANCHGNKFENSCTCNTFGTGCNDNIFGTNCGGNKFGNNCYSNTFGTNCGNITFGQNGDLKDYYKNIIFENGNNNIFLYCSATTSYSLCFRNVKIAQGVNNTTTYKTITHPTAGDMFQTIYQPTNSQIISV